MLAEWSEKGESVLFIWQQEKEAAVVAAAPLPAKVFALLWQWWVRGGVVALKASLVTPRKVTQLSLSAVAPWPPSNFPKFITDYFGKMTSSCLTVQAFFVLIKKRIVEREIF